MGPRVLLLATPLDARAHLDGTRLAIVELAAALRAQKLATPLVLARTGVPVPEGCERIEIAEGGGPPAIVRASVRARPSLVHAVFAPRRRTGIVLGAIRAALRVPVVQTIPSWSGAVPLRWPSIVGDVVVATSAWMERKLTEAGLDGARRARVPMPFSAPLDVVPDRTVKQPLFLHVGDWEDGSGVEETLEAFAQLSSPYGVVPHLAFAGRRKTDRSARREADVRAEIEASIDLRSRVRVLGELPSLLPFVAAARCVLLPASTTAQKLDHPRALLEAIALGTRVVVGRAPSLAELVTAPSIGEVADGSSQLREAMERTLEALAPTPADVMRVLAPRRPVEVAAAYGELYARVRSRGRAS